MFKSEYLQELCNSALYQVVAIGQAKVESSKPDEWIKSAVKECFKQIWNVGSFTEPSDVNAIVTDVAVGRIKEILEIRDKPNKIRCFEDSMIKKDEYLAKGAYQKVLLVGLKKTNGYPLGDVYLAMLLQTKV